MSTFNKLLKKVSPVIVSIVVFTCSLKGQVKTGFPTVGDPLPEYTLRNLTNFPGQQVNLNEFRGKWLILDFWAHSCSGCIASFPKMDALHKEFKDQVQILLVAATKARTPTPKGRLERLCKEIFRKKKEKYQMTIPTAFDTLLWEKLDVGSFPYILVVDSTGVIRYKTDYIERDQIITLLKGGNPKFSQAYTYSDIPEYTKYNPELPLLTKGKMANGGPDTSFLFRSMLTEYNEGMPVGQVIDLYDPIKKNGVNVIKSGRLELFKKNVTLLYRMAYFGTAHWIYVNKNHYENLSKQLALNIRDSTLFDRNTTRLFSYSLKVPPSKSNAEFLMKVLQRDIDNYFGFLSRKVRKSMPVYYLEAADTALLKTFKTKGGGNSGLVSSDYDHYNFRNVSFDGLLGGILSLFNLDQPVYNKVGFNFNIDIDFKADFQDDEDVRNKLKNYGLKLTKGFREMDVIEISDTDRIVHQNKKTGL